MRIVPTTLIDIARNAGVSHTTVSRVLNGRQSIAEATRKKVLAAAEQLGYRPNRSAQALVGRKPSEATLSVEVVLCHLSPKHQEMPEGYFMRMVRGCDAAARADSNVEWRVGYWNQQQEGKELEERVAGKPNCGVVLMGRAQAEMVQRLANKGVAVVLADQDLPDVSVDAAVPDNFSGGLWAARHLLARGYHRVGALSGPAAEVSWCQRLAGVRAGLAEAGILITPHDCRNPAGENLYNVEIEIYERAMREWLSDSDRPQALVLPCAMLASVVQRVMLEKHLLCPRDLAMVCFDDDVFVSLCVTEPTRIDTRPQLVGQKAMERLIYLLRHPEAESSPHKTVVANRVIEGLSVGQANERTESLSRKLMLHGEMQCDRISLTTAINKNPSKDARTYND